MHKTTLLVALACSCLTLGCGGEEDKGPAAGTMAAGTGAAGTGLAGTMAAGTGAAGTATAGTAAAGTAAAGTAAAGTAAAGTAAAGTGALPPLMCAGTPCTLPDDLAAAIIVAPCCTAADVCGMMTTLGGCTDFYADPGGHMCTPGIIAGATVPGCCAADGVRCGVVDILLGTGCYIREDIPLLPLPPLNCDGTTPPPPDGGTPSGPDGGVAGTGAAGTGTAGTMM